MSSRAYPAAKRGRFWQRDQGTITSSGTRQGRGLGLRPTATPRGQDHTILLLRKKASDPKHVQA